MSDKSGLRKKVYVSRMIQGRLLQRLAMYWGLYHLVLWHTMFLYRCLQYRGELLAGGQPVPFAELYGGFVAQHYSVVVCALAVFPIVFWDMLRQTHRVAGPLVRFQNALRQLAAGEPVERIRLRKGDLVLELQDAFNEFLESAQSPSAPSRKAERETAPAATAAPSVDDPPSSRRSDHGLDEILHEIEQLDDELEAVREAPARNR
jgi:methyl-accepting chemotaxis protein